MKIIILIIFCVMILCVNISYSEGGIMEIKDFQKEVLESEKLVIVDFWATWCRPCKLMSANLERIVEFKYNKNKLEVYKINVDENRKLMSKYLIRGLPTVIFFKDGKEVSRIIGLTPLLKYRKKLNLY